MTLSDESAGGVSVGYLIASSLIEGLFQRAIIQSVGVVLQAYPRASTAGTARGVAESWHVAKAEPLIAVSATMIRSPVAAFPGPTATTSTINAHSRGRRWRRIPPATTASAFRHRGVFLT